MEEFSHKTLPLEKIKRIHKVISSVPPYPGIDIRWITSLRQSHAFAIFFQFSVNDALCLCMIWSGLLKLLSIRALTS